jgi:hypothetical protein
MSFKDYSQTPADNTTLGDGTYIGPNMLRNKVRPSLQQIASDGRELYDEVIARGAGGALPAFIQAGTGAVERTAQSKLRDIVSALDFGAAGGGADDTTKLQASLTAAGAQSAVFLPAGDFKATSALTNPGARFTGPGLIYRDKGDGLGKQVQNRRGRDIAQKVLGREYLARFWNYLSRFGVVYSATAWLVGDSVTATYSGPILQSYFATVPGMGTVTNNAIGGTSIEQWVAGTGGYAASGKALSNWIAAPTDLLYISFGINSPYYGGSPASFAAALETALIAIRAARDSTQTSVFVALPLASKDGGAMSSEGGWKRDEYYVAKLRALCEPFVDKYRICLYDQSLETPAADVDSGGTNEGLVWLENGVHPIEGYKYFLAGQIFDALVPISLRSATPFTASAASVAPATGFTLGADPEPLRVQRRGGVGVTSGYVNMTTPGVISSGTVIATIPTGYRPTDKQWWVDIVPFSTGTTFERVRGIVDTNGQISLAQNTTLSPTRVYVYATWVCA